MELIKPFALTGEKEDFSVDTDPDGKVSLEKGFTQLYEMKPTEGGLFILRKIFNQMMYLVTNDAVKWKTQTFGDWNENITYPKNAIVRYTDGNTYVSLIDDNEDEPTDTNSWKLYDSYFLKYSNISYNVNTSSFIPNTLTSGVIIERGSNANGEYIKFADGTMICYILTPIITDNNNGGTFFNLPHAFLDVSYHLSCNARGIYSTTLNGSFVAECVTASKASFRVKVLNHLASAISNTTDVPIYVIAIGRWK